MTELEDIKAMRRVIENRAKEVGGYEKLASELSTKKVKFTGSLIGMVVRGSRSVSTKLARALGYEKVIKYRRVK